MPKFEELEQKLEQVPDLTLFAKMFDYWYIKLYRDGKFIIEWSKQKENLIDPLAINSFQNGKSLRELNERLLDNAFDLEAISIDKWVEDIQDLP